MSFDLAAYLGAVTRVVRDAQHEGKPAKAVIATRVYAADVDQVWDAMTNPERIPRWFLPVSGSSRSEGATSSRATLAAPSRTARPRPTSA